MDNMDNIDNNTSKLILNLVKNNSIFDNINELYELYCNNMNYEYLYYKNYFGGKL